LARSRSDWPAELKSSRIHLPLLPEATKVPRFQKRRTHKNGGRQCRRRPGTQNHRSSFRKSMPTSRFREAAWVGWMTSSGRLILAIPTEPFRSQSSTGPVDLRRHSCCHRNSRERRPKSCRPHPLHARITADSEFPSVPCGRGPAQVPRRCWFLGHIHWH